MIKIISLIIAFGLIFSYGNRPLPAEAHITFSIDKPLSLNLLKFPLLKAYYASLGLLPFDAALNTGFSTSIGGSGISAYDSGSGSSSDTSYSVVDTSAGSSADTSGSSTSSDTSAVAESAPTSAARFRMAAMATPVITPIVANGHTLFTRSSVPVPVPSSRASFGLRAAAAPRYQTLNQNYRYQHQPIWSQSRPVSAWPLRPTRIQMTNFNQMPLSRRVHYIQRLPIPRAERTLRVNTISSGSSGSSSSTDEAASAPAASSWVEPTQAPVVETQTSGSEATITQTETRTSSDSSSGNSGTSNTSAAPATSTAPRSSSAESGAASSETNVHSFIERMEPEARSVHLTAQV